MSKSTLPKANESLNFKSYEHSGNYTISSILLILFTGIMAAILIGAIGYPVMKTSVTIAVRFFRYIYKFLRDEADSPIETLIAEFGVPIVIGLGSILVVIAIVIGLGALHGGVMSYAIRKGKCRNIGIAIGLTLFVAMIGCSISTYIAFTYFEEKTFEFYLILLVGILSYIGGAIAVVLGQAVEESGEIEVIEEPGEIEVIEEPDEIIEEPGEIEVIEEPGEIIEEPGEIEVIEEPGEIEVIEEPGEIEVIEEPDEIEVRVNQISFGEATRILEFLQENEANFHNQVRFLKALIEGKMYPNLQVVSFKKSDPSASCGYLIVMTGSKKEYIREVPHQTEEEIFNRVHPGQDWKVMWANKTVMNIAPPGHSLTDMKPFDDILMEIKKGLYSIDERLSKEGQSSKLDSIDDNKTSLLIALSENGLFCRSCKGRYALEQVYSPRLTDDGLEISFECPRCQPAVLYGRRSSSWGDLPHKAWFLATCPYPEYRDGKQAIEFAKKAVEEEKVSFSLDALAAAYAEIGDFQEAIKFQEEAISLREKEKDSDDKEQCLTTSRKRLASYQAEKPWREKPKVVKEE